MPRCSALIRFALLMAVIFGCSQSGGGAFCEQAEFFQSRSVRDANYHTEDRSVDAYLNALTSLRDIASGTLRDDLDILIAQNRATTR